MSNPNESSYCRIEIPGTEVTIRLRWGLLERLTAEIEDVLAATGRESGGILLGSFSGQALEVEDYDPVPSRHHSDSRCYLHSDIDRGRMAGAVTLWSPQGESRLRVIGFYRSNDRPALAAGDEERNAFASELSGAASVLLLVQAGANGWTTLTCYLAENGQPTGRAGRIEIDLKQPKPAVAEGPAAAVSRCEVKPQITPARREKSRTRLARFTAVLFPASLLWLGYMQYVILKGMNTEASPAQRPPALGLEVKPQGAYWRVSWNRSSALLALAARGRLRIEDGATHKDVDLDAAELPSTSVIYDPGGSDITFHLELFGTDGARSAGESLHVFAKLPSGPCAQPAVRSQAQPADASSAAGIEPAGATTQPLAGNTAFTLDALGGPLRPMFLQPESLRRTNQ